jgi:hypothetical protein
MKTAVERSKTQVDSPASRRQSRFVHRFQLSTGSCQVMRSRIRCPCRSIHCSVIQQASMSIDSARVPQTAVSATSLSENLDGVICAPQRGQISLVPAPLAPCKPVQFRHRDAKAFIIVFLLFIAGLLTPSRCRVGRPLTLVSPDIQQLFSNRVFRGKAVLNVRLEECLIRNASLQDIGMMLFVQAHERFRRDGVGSPLAAASDRCLKPFLFDPKDDLRFSNAEGACKALHRKQITPDLAQTEVISPKHVANCLWCPIDPFRDFFDRSLHQFFTDRLEFGFRPSSVILPSFDSMLNDQAPARFLRAPTVTLKTNCELFEFVAGKHFGLRSHSHSVSTPLRGPLRQLRKGCHVRLYIIKAIDKGEIKC